MLTIKDLISSTATATNREVNHSPRGDCDAERFSMSQSSTMFSKEAALVFEQGLSVSPKMMSKKKSNFETLEKRYYKDNKCTHMRRECGSLKNLHL